MAFSNSRAAVALAASLPALAFAATPVPLATAPASATVFPGGALIERTGTVKLAQGHHRLALVGFPARMDDASVRIRVSRGTHLVGFAVEQVPVADVVSPAARALEQEEEQLLGDDKILSDQRTVLSDRRSFLLSLRTTFQLRVSHNLGLGPVDVAALGAVHVFTAARLAKVAKDEQALDAKREKVGRGLDLVRRKLAQLASKREKQTKALAVDVRAAEDGETSVEVKYVVPGASWSSTYDAHLDGKGVKLVHHAIVRQETGEDWEGVKLRLSSADTTSRASVPVLAAAYLSLTPPYNRHDNYWNRQRRQPARRYYRGRLGGLRGGATTGAPAGAMPTTPAEPAFEPPEIAQAVSVARSSEFAATYDVLGTVSVASDGAPRKITITTAPLEASVVHESTPRLQAGALLVAEIVHRGEVPLLPGSVSLFLGKDYVGETSVAFTGTGGKLRLPFGRDDRLRVTRTRVSRLVSKEGVFTKEYKIAYQYKLRVQNLVGRPVKLALKDLVPASTDERIKVDIDEATTPRSPNRPEDAKGTLRWDLDLPPGDARELFLGYSVRYPRTLPVSGLE